MNKLLHHSAIDIRIEDDKDTQEAPTVLVVDDEPMNVFVVKSLLELEGVNANVAYCGKEGVQHVQDRVR